MRRPVPSVGMRMVKSAVAVLICLLLSMWVDREGMRIYSSMAALWCIRPYWGDTWKMACQRIYGTAIGSVFGAAVIFLQIYALEIWGTAIGYLIIALCIIPVLWSAIGLGLQDVAYFSSVVFLSITVTNISNADHWLFLWYRVVETLIGIGVGVAVNACHLPRKKRRDTLFVCGLDGVLLTLRDELTPYSHVTLNRLLDDGALITLATMRTPASVREATEGLRFQLPIIVMDGAAMYDLKKKAYLHARTLSGDLARRCREVFEGLEVHCFLNCVLDDVLMIYYGELRNEAERTIHETLRTSPYRNFVAIEHYGGGEVLYLMAIDRTERMEQVMAALRETGLAEQVKIRFYPSEDYPGYSYIKIYARGASRQAMLEELKKELNVEKAVTFSSVEGQGDVVLHDRRGNRVVRALERMYEPFVWEK